MLDVKDRIPMLRIWIISTVAYAVVVLGMLKFLELNLILVQIVPLVFLSVFYYLKNIIIPTENNILILVRLSYAAGLAVLSWVSCSVVGLIGFMIIFSGGLALP